MVTWRIGDKVEAIVNRPIASNMVIGEIAIIVNIDREGLQLKTSDDRMWFVRKYHVNNITSREREEMMANIVLKDGEAICSYCGEIVKEDSTTIVHGEVICEDCLADNFTFCDNCEKYHSNSDNFYSVWVGGNEQIWCRECAINYSRVCDDCGDRHATEEIDRDGIYLCDDCIDNWGRCADCGDWVRYGDEYSDDDCNWYCSDCYRDKTRSIHDYSYKPEPIFYGDSKLFFGVELEVDRGDSPNDFADSLKEEQEIYCKHDGSLGSYGVEVVTHPCSIAYHKNHIWEEVIEQACKYNFKSHDTSTCGLHVHVNKDGLGDSREARELVQAKLLLLIDRFYDNEILKFSRRKEGELSRWAKKPNANILVGDSPDELRDKARDVARSGRYYALNLENRNTIEFRFFKGTLKKESIIASIELCDALVQYAKKTSVYGVSRGKFTTIIKQYGSKNLTRYCMDRGLFN